MGPWREHIFVVSSGCLYIRGEGWGRRPSGMDASDTLILAALVDGSQYPKSPYAMAVSPPPPLRRGRGVACLRGLFANLFLQKGHDRH
jgi:hypothetical protein